MLVSGVGDHRGEQQSGCQHGDSEHGDGHALPGRALLQGVADDPGGKREERDREQEEQVQPQEDPIHVVKIVGEAVVGDPGCSDRQEADEVDEVGRPVAQELLKRRTRRPQGKVEHQQRDRDREHAVAERLHPALTQSSTSGRYLLVVSHDFRHVKAAAPSSALGKAPGPSGSSAPHDRREQRLTMSSSAPCERWLAAGL